MKKTTLIFSFILSLAATAVFSQNANVQIIHNSPDLAVDTVDIYLNATKVEDNIAFREATSFLSVPAGVSFDITVQPKTSVDTTAGLYRQSFLLNNNESYVVVANGIVSATGYNPSPSFALNIQALARDTSLGGADSVDVLIAHGSTDAGAVDIYESSVVDGTISNDLLYGNFDGYLQLDTLDYELQVRNSQNSQILAAFSAPLRSNNLGGQAITVVASGFVDPAQNSGGPAFGLYVATASGGQMLQLPAAEIPTAEVQIIHNSPDTNARFVDVYLNEDLIVDNLEFRTATPFVEVQAGVPFVVSIADSSSADTMAALRQFTYDLMPDSAYQIVAAGLLSSAPLLDLHETVGLSDTAATDSTVAVRIYHGGVDAPTIDIYETNVPAGKIASKLNYSEFLPYLELDTLNYRIELIDANTNQAVKAYTVPLQALNLEGSAVTVLASGAIDTAANPEAESFGLWVALSSGGNLIELTEVPVENTTVQIIHNSADTAATLVDVWLDNNRILDNVSYRTASQYLPIKTGATAIAITDENSTDTTNAFGQFNFNLMANSTYQIIAAGTASSTGFSPNQEFDLHVFASAKDTSVSDSTVDVLVYHGATDAPTVDIFESSVPAGTIVNDISYSEFDNYITLDTANYLVQVINQNNSAILGAYKASIQALAGEAVTILASGFADTSLNSGGANFGLWVARPTGGNLIELALDTIPTTLVQVIHNSADASAAVVDVWVNEARAIDNLEFRNATPFINVRTDIPVTITVADSSSANSATSIIQNNIQLNADTNYQIIAAGINSATGYIPSPNFELDIYRNAKTIAPASDEVDVLVYHGSTDAPTIDVFETNLDSTLVNDISYGEFSGYLRLDSGNYSLEIRNEANTVILAAFDAPLRAAGLSGQAVTVLASGFLDTALNSNGANFGLWLANAGGGPLLPLTVDPILVSRAQIIHNSADTIAEAVDVYLNDQIIVDNMQFRTATPYIDVQTGLTQILTIINADSTSFNDPFYSDTLRVFSDSTYQIIANGIASRSGFTPNQNFEVDIYSKALEVATDPAKVDVLVYHGSTDAPRVDVFESSVPAGTLVDNITYGSFTDYLSLDPLDYTLQLRNETSNEILAAYSAPLASLSLGGEAITVLASGFFNPAVNSDGPALGLWVASAAGGNLIELPSSKIPTARVQLIHASADAAADEVDLWINNKRFVNDMKFKDVVGFVDLQAGLDIDVTVAPSNRNDTNVSYVKRTFNLDTNLTYQIIASGITSGSAANYNPAPPFSLNTITNARESSANSAVTDINVFHAITDGPAINIVETAVSNNALIADGLNYGEFAPFVTLNTGNFRLSVVNDLSGAELGLYNAPFDSILRFGGDAISIIATGFAVTNDSTNNGGELFGLHVSLPEGGRLFRLNLITSLLEVKKTLRNEFVIYPNPSSGLINLKATGVNNDSYLVEIFDLSGKQVYANQLSLPFTNSIDLSDVSKGTYIVKFSTDESYELKKIILK